MYSARVYAYLHDSNLTVNDNGEPLYNVRAAIISEYALPIRGRGLSICLY